MTKEISLKSNNCGGVKSFSASLKTLRNIACALILGLGAAVSAHAAPPAAPTVSEAELNEAGNILTIALDYTDTDVVAVNIYKKGDLEPFLSCAVDANDDCKNIELSGKGMDPAPVAAGDEIEVAVVNEDSNQQEQESEKATHTVTQVGSATAPTAPTVSKAELNEAGNKLTLEVEGAAEDDTITAYTADGSSSIGSCTSNTTGSCEMNVSGVNANDGIQVTLTKSAAGSVESEKAPYTVTQAGATPTSTVTIDGVPTTELAVGATATLTAKDSSDLSATFTWESSDPESVKVEADPTDSTKATVEVLKKSATGKVIITATSSTGEKDSVELTVVKTTPDPATDFEIQHNGAAVADPLEIEAGETAQLALVFIPTGSASEVTWTSADPAIATIDGNTLTITAANLTEEQTVALTATMQVAGAAAPVVKTVNVKVTPADPTSTPSGSSSASSAIPFPALGWFALAGLMSALGFGVLRRRG